MTHILIVMRIHFYGCSFTKGGGLHGKNYHKFYEKNWYPKLWKLRGKEFLHSEENLFYDYSDFYNFPTVIENKTGVLVSNHSIVGNNNDHIFNTVYKNSILHPDDIHIVQWTLLHRRNIHNESTNKVYRCQGHPDHIQIFNLSDDTFLTIDDNLISLETYYRDYLINHYNEQLEKDNILRLSNLLYSMNNNIFFISYEELDDVSSIDNFILFDHMYLREYMTTNHLTIKDETNGDVDDLHLSIKGHSIISDYIISSISPRIRW